MTLCVIHNNHINRKPPRCDRKMARQSGVFPVDNRDRISLSRVLAFLRLSTAGTSAKSTFFSLAIALKSGSAQASASLKNIS